MKRQGHGGNGGGGCGQSFLWLSAILAGLLLWPVATHGDNVYWIGLGGSDDWSVVGNWFVNPLSHVPGATDNVFFDVGDTGNVNVVDTNDVTIGRLRYLGNSVHTLDLDGGNHLQVANGPVQVGWDTDAAVTWTNGGSVTVGTPSASQSINVGRNGTTSGMTTGSLTVNGVHVDANVDNNGDTTQSGGIAVGVNWNQTGLSTGSANGTLILGSDSQLNAGTPADPMAPGLTIGYHYGNVPGSTGSGTGWVDTSDGTANLHVNELYVGNNLNGYGVAGSATGTLITGDDTTLSATTAYIGRGVSATGTVDMGGGQFAANDAYFGKDGGTGTMNMNGGLFVANTVHMGPGSGFNFNAGRLAVKDFYAGGSAGTLETLEQKGGTMAPSGVSTIHGNYQLDAGGTLEIDLLDTGHDRLNVTGSVALAGGLDLKLNYEPLVGTQFVIITSDGGSGAFAGLEGPTNFLEEIYLDSTYKFRISYDWSSENDVMLEMIEKIGEGTPVTIPAPGALMLGGIGVGVMNWLRRRRTL